MDNAKFCKKCGKVLVDGEKFCANCGAPVDDETTTENTTSGGTPTTYKYVGTKTPKTYGNSGYDVAGFILGLLSVILGGFLFAILGLVFSKKNKDTNGLAKAGYILSIIGLVVSVIYIVLIAVLQIGANIQ